jgi:hypothetical protein
LCTFATLSSRRPGIGFSLAGARVRPLEPSSLWNLLDSGAITTVLTPGHTARLRAASRARRERWGRVSRRAGGNMPTSWGPSFHTHPSLALLGRIQNLRGSNAFFSSTELFHPFRGSFHRGSPPRPQQFSASAQLRPQKGPWSRLGPALPPKVRCALFSCSVASWEPESLPKSTEKTCVVLYNKLYVLYELGHTPGSALNTAGLWNRLF